MPRIHRTRCWKEESCRERERERTLKNFRGSPLRIHLDIDQCVLVGKLPKARERPPEMNGGNNAWCLHRAGYNAWFYKAEWKNLMVCGVLSRIHRRVLPRSWGVITSKLNTALVLPITF